MKEIGGYLEFENYNNNMIHNDAIALNCGRNCLAYLIRARKIQILKIPYFICKSVYDICDRERIEKRYYHIGMDFLPKEDLTLEEGEWIYLVNYYGQLSNDYILNFVEKYKRVIVDQTNAYYDDPLPNVDTIYSCRKWFGVADGAFLYTSSVLGEKLEVDESFDRMEFILGRFERTASEFYEQYKKNNLLFGNEPIKQMSKLTLNLLHGINYDAVKKRREENFIYLNDRLKDYNLLKIRKSLFMYPLMIEDAKAIRKELQDKKIYIPVLWPNVFNLTEPNDIEYRLAEKILPIPIDQRYNIDDMEYISSIIEYLIKKEMYNE